MIFPRSFLRAALYSLAVLSVNNFTIFSAIYFGITDDSVVVGTLLLSVFLTAAITTFFLMGSTDGHN